jgi:hypothetical protein
MSSTYVEIAHGLVVNYVIGAIPRVGVTHLDAAMLETLPPIGWRHMGGTTFEPPLAFSRPEADVKRDAIATVNRLAGESRARYMVSGPGQETTYLLKGDELDALAIEQGTPDPANYPMLASEAQATGMAFEDVVALVATTREQWKQLAAYVEALRRGAIVRIEAATTEQAVRLAIPSNWP